MNTSGLASGGAGGAAAVLPAPELPAAPSRGAAIRLHASIHLRRLLHWRHLWPVVVLMVVDAVAAGGVARMSPDEPKLLLELLGSVGLRSVGLVALGLGTQALRADADHGAMSAFLLRPRARVALPLGRFLTVSAVVASWALLLVLLTQGVALAVALPLPLARLPMIGAAFVLAAAGYTAVFMLMAALVRPAAAFGLAWLVLFDLGLGSASDRIARLTPAGAVKHLLHFDPDLSLFGAAGAGVWLAVANILVLTAACLGLTLLRFRGDVTET